MWSYILIAPARFERVEVPTPGVDSVPDGWVRLKLLAGGICGSDLPYFKGQNQILSPEAVPRGPRQVGKPLHEIVGEIVLSKHLDHAIGDRVVGWASRGDGLAEYVVSSGDRLVKFDSALSSEHAVMIQPLACVLHAMNRLEPVEGKHVAVLGQGPIGLLFSHVAKSRGARKVVGVDWIDRSEASASFGVDEFEQLACDRWASGLLDSDRPELTIEAIGHQVSTLNAAVDATVAGGQIFYFGEPDDTFYPFSMSTFFRKDLALMSGRTSDHSRNLMAANEYLHRYPELVDSYVTHIMPVDDVQDAFNLAARPKAGQNKIVISTVGQLASMEGTN
ncbi:alcohol dehydrogenase catalytic domain-containing protein [Ferrimicrobium acidiphilum]|uniref:alcohol dehydrogenase catalytic domain-containing protein n=1 Tax=Ferrimicrobium acidiphilum TaxID=121039 RepID=UPI0023F52D02|nr:alcohol dehydrogenase catalytic domain-containing protein [Ferrimicrobium acidiphilum]